MEVRLIFAKSVINQRAQSKVFRIVKVVHYFVFEIKTNSLIENSKNIQTNNFYSSFSFLEG